MNAAHVLPDFAAANDGRPCLSQCPAVADASQLCTTLREKLVPIDAEIRALEGTIVACQAAADPVADALASAAPDPAARERARLAELVAVRDRTALAIDEAEARVAQAQREASEAEVLWARREYLGAVQGVLAAASRLREALAREPAVRDDLYRRGFDLPRDSSLAFTYDRPIEECASLLDRLVLDAERFLMEREERANERITVIALIDLPEYGVEMGRLFEITRAEAAALAGSVDTNPKARPFRKRKRIDPTFRLYDTRTMGGERVSFHRDLPPARPPVEDEIEYE